MRKSAFNARGAREAESSGWCGEAIVDSSLDTFRAHEGRLRGALAFGDAVQAALQITAGPSGWARPVAAERRRPEALTLSKISVTSLKTNRVFLRLFPSLPVAVPPKRLPPLNSLRAF